ncbi:SusC/RagA family TonB-linked outer membrane protein [Parapedobacter pyrenivorans]|uniref:SusC/RagA family TonB-linked outer membrane protein n=1 Tax=Parapedobacter pyrenivorans TaxID=1305674 RepID=A0A917HAF1_9SPHI|nr:TonB-dependent receptor [Parapedobacter pyrenivorans]GGG72875.1 SusC/RagA family TonB-linked outer membrane protein [Parapedobacter pyrenivorans]
MKRKCSFKFPIREIGLKHEALLLRMVLVLASAFLTMGVAQGQALVSGVVRAVEGQPLPGASISVAGTDRQTRADSDGHFRITTNQATDSLVVSFVGYVSKTIPIGGATYLEITLEAGSGQLDEVIVVGYGTQKKINLTGSVAQMDGEILQNRAVSNIGQALQGAAGNLNISPSGEGGGPGAVVNYNIRGATTLSGSGSPFFVVDGVPVENINHLNAADIQSVTVLKDAASSTIYGARAAYGVILITTKTGSAAKTIISYRNNFGFNEATRIPDQVNSLEFAEAYNIASLNAGQSPMFTAEHIDRIRAYMADPINTPSNIPNPNNPDFWSYATLENDNVDWIRAIFKPGTENQKHDLSVSGGGEKVTYYVGLGRFNEGGLLRYGDEKFNRWTVTNNLTFKPLKWLRGDIRLRYHRENKNIPSPGHNNNIGNWMHFASTRFPNWALKDPNGNWALTSEMGRQWEGRGIFRDDMLNLTGALELEPIRDWKINMDYTYRLTNAKSSSQIKPFAWEHTVAGEPIMNVNNFYATDMSQQLYNTGNIYTSYQRVVGGHFIGAMTGFQLELTEFDYLYGMKRDLISPNLPSIGVATGDSDTRDQLTHWANMGFFGRLNYNFNETYLAEVNFRYDGTSKFPSDRRFGFFPSISLGYNIANENFWSIKDKVGLLKLRASYGSLGNQDVPNYLYLNTMGIGTRYAYILGNELPNYLAAPGLVSQNLTWETATTINLGVDAAFLQNRLTTSLDWYTRTTTNMFGPANALPASLGAAVPLLNNADLQTKGFELAIGWNDRVQEQFAYRVQLILSDNVGKVIRYNNPTGILSTYYEGQRIGEIWGYETEGIIQQDADVERMADQSYIWGTWGLGDMMYKDQNGDGKIDIGDNTHANPGDLKVIGNSSSRYNFSTRLGVTWKSFDVDLFIQGVMKRDFSPAYHGNAGVFYWGFTGGYGSNLYRETLDFWTPSNTDAFLPKPYNSGEVRKNQQSQTRYLENAAYARLKNIQIGYTLPASLTNPISITNLRLFVSGENLYTLSSIQKNFDPELTGGSWGSGKVYPLMRTFSFGVNVDF